MKVKDLLHHYDENAEIKIDGFDSIVSIVNSDEEEVILDPGINIPIWHNYTIEKPTEIGYYLVTFDFGKKY